MGTSKEESAGTYALPRVSCGLPLYHIPPLFLLFFLGGGGCQLHTSPRYVLLLLLNIFQKAIGLVQKWCCSGKVFFSRKTINLGTKHLIFIPGIRFWGSYIQKITFNITTPLYLKPRKLWSGASPLTRALSKGPVAGGDDIKENLIWSFWWHDPSNPILGDIIRCFVPRISCFLEKKTLPKQHHFKVEICWNYQ